MGLASEKAPFTSELECGFNPNFAKSFQFSLGNLVFAHRDVDKML